MSYYHKKIVFIFITSTAPTPWASCYLQFVQFGYNCAISRCFLVAVKVKWGKEVFPNVEVNTDEEPMLFKAQLFALTGVQPERQKVMLKGMTLKDDDWGNIKLKDVSISVFEIRYNIRFQGVNWIHKDQIDDITKVVKPKMYSMIS